MTILIAECGCGGSLKCEGYKDDIAKDFYDAWVKIHESCDPLAKSKAGREE